MIKLNQNLRFIFSKNVVSDAKSYFFTLSELALKVDKSYLNLTKMDEILYWDYDSKTHFAGFSVIGFENLDVTEFYIDTTKGNISEMCDESNHVEQLVTTEHRYLAKVDVASSTQQSIKYSQFIKLLGQSD